jgi:hypothetical protein
MTEAVRQSWCGRSGSSVLKFGFHLDCLLYTHTAVCMYTQLRRAQNSVGALSFGTWLLNKSGNVRVWGSVKCACALPCEIWDSHSFEYQYCRIQYVTPCSLASIYRCFLGRYIHPGIFHREDGGSSSLSSVGKFLPHHMTSLPLKTNFRTSCPFTKQMVWFTRTASKSTARYAILNTRAVGWAHKPYDSDSIKAQYVLIMVNL